MRTTREGNPHKEDPMSEAVILLVAVAIHVAHCRTERTHLEMIEHLHRMMSE